MTSATGHIYWCMMKETKDTKIQRKQSEISAKRLLLFSNARLRHVHSHTNRIANLTTPILSPRNRNTNTEHQEYRKSTRKLELESFSVRKWIGPLWVAKGRIRGVGEAENCNHTSDWTDYTGWQAHGLVTQDTIRFSLSCWTPFQLTSAPSRFSSSPKPSVQLWKAETQTSHADSLVLSPPTLDGTSFKEAIEEFNSGAGPFLVSVDS